jgi:hypothetical protein
MKEKRQLKMEIGKLETILLYVKGNKIRHNKNTMCDNDFSFLRGKGF